MEVDQGDILKVRIFGEEYKITGDADREYTDKVAGYVDSKMQEVSKSFPGRPFLKIAVLAALNIADELFSERRQTENLLSEVSTKAARLRESLEAAIR